MFQTQKHYAGNVFTLLLLWNKEHAFIYSDGTIFQKRGGKIKGIPQHGSYKSEN